MCDNVRQEVLLGSALYLLASAMQNLNLMIGLWEVLVTNAKVLLPCEVDIAKCIALKSSFNGARLDVEKLSRLQESCVQIKDEVLATVSFEQDANGLRIVKGTCEADLVLTCQRCAEDYVEHVVSKFNFTPDYERAKACNLENKYDFIELNEGKVNLYEIIEDGLILEIPTVPKHDEDDPECTRHGDEWQYGELDSAAQTNPFAALAALKGSLGKKD